jgi:hypothetical protein
MVKTETTPTEKQRYRVTLTAEAFVSSTVYVSAFNEEDARRRALQYAREGGASWQYDGVQEGTQETQEAEQSPGGVGIDVALFEEAAAAVKAHQAARDLSHEPAPGDDNEAFLAALDEEFVAALDTYAKENAGRAERALDLVKQVNGCDDMEASITDLLVDLRHLCAACSYDYEELDRSAERHYTIERLQAQTGVEQ